MLQALDESTAVTTSGAARIAGRDAYELVLTPKQSDTLVSRVVIAMDAEMRIPLRVQVFSTQLPGPAYEVGFTSVDFSTPDAELFAFTPPTGATVTDHAADDMKAAAGDEAVAPDAKLAPTVVGTGWSQVVIATLPTDLVAGVDAPASEESDGSSAHGRARCRGAARVAAPHLRGVGDRPRAQRHPRLGDPHRRRPSRDRSGGPGGAGLGPGRSVTSAAIATVGLTKRFGSQAAVDGIDLDVPQGAVYGFLGPNGSGKTTTIRMLLGLVHPTEGRIEVLGEPIPGRSGAVLPRVGSLVEGPAFHPYLSGRANLARLDAADRHADPSTSRARIDAALERVGLLAAARKRYRAYSLGMRQRLAIAAALLTPRDLLLLDEPTNGLDPQGTREVRSLVASLAADGATVLISSHLLSEVEQICSHLGVMRQGRLVAQGAIGDVRAGSRPVAEVETAHARTGPPRCSGASA